MFSTYLRHFAAAPPLALGSWRRAPLHISCGMRQDEFYIRHENGRMNKTAGKKAMDAYRKLARALVDLPDPRLPSVLPFLEPGMIQSLSICRKMDT